MNRLSERAEKKNWQAKRVDEIETEEYGEQSDQSGMGEPADFVFDVPICPR